MHHKKCEYSKNVDYISTPCAPPLDMYCYYYKCLLEIISLLDRYEIGCYIKDSAQLNQADSFCWGGES